MTALTARSTTVYGPKTLSTDVAAPSPVNASADGADDVPSAEGVPATWAGDDPGLRTHHDSWVDRVATSDRVVVPGAGTAIRHRACVEDVASAVRVVAECGTPGEAYNVGDRRACTMEDVVHLVADALETSVTVVRASERDLAAAGLDRSGRIWTG